MLSVCGDKAAASGGPTICPLVVSPVESSEGWETAQLGKAASSLCRWPCSVKVTLSTGLFTGTSEPG